MHLHPVLASQVGAELQRERTERAVAASELRRRLDEQPEGRVAGRRGRRRRRLLAHWLNAPRHVA
jgi:hypothetical protein